MTESAPSNYVADPDSPGLYWGPEIETENFLIVASWTRGTGFGLNVERLPELTPTEALAIAATLIQMSAEMLGGQSFESSFRDATSDEAVDSISATGTRNSAQMEPS